MVTVREVSTPYENFLVPVLSPGDGVCAICKRAILPGWSTCYQCSTHSTALSRTADVVVPVALSVKGEQWAYELSSYKNSSNMSARSSLAVGIGAVLWRWLDAHEACAQGHASVHEFPLVVPVPSTRNRADHPLPDILSNIVKPTSARCADLLSSNPRYPGDSREAHDDRFLVSTQLTGEPVMIIDDQWTSGSRAQSAAAALKLAGSGPVAVVALGRHFDRSPSGEQYQQTAEHYYRSARALGWNWTECCLCRHS